MLAEETLKIFDKQDTPLLKNCEDDGTPVIQYTIFLHYQCCDRWFKVGKDKLVN